MEAFDAAVDDYVRERDRYRQLIADMEKAELAHAMLMRSFQSNIEKQNIVVEAKRMEIEEFKR